MKLKHYHFILFNKKNGKYEPLNENTIYHPKQEEMKTLLFLILSMALSIACTAQKKVVGKYFSINGQSGINSFYILIGMDHFWSRGVQKLWRLQIKGNGKLNATLWC